MDDEVAIHIHINLVAVGEEMTEWCPECLLPSVVAQRFELLNVEFGYMGWLHYARCEDCGLDLRTVCARTATAQHEGTLP